MVPWVRFNRRCWIARVGMDGHARLAAMGVNCMWIAKSIRRVRVIERNFALRYGHEGLILFL